MKKGDRNIFKAIFEVMSESGSYTLFSSNGNKTTMIVSGQF